MHQRILESLRGGIAAQNAESKPNLGEEGKQKKNKGGPDLVTCGRGAPRSGRPHGNAERILGLKRHGGDGPPSRGVHGVEVAGGREGWGSRRGFGGGKEGEASACECNLRRE